MDNKNWHLFSITILELQILCVLLHEFKAFLIIGNVILTMSEVKIYTTLF